MRSALLFSLLYLTACASGHGPASYDQAPGLDIADAALASGAPDTALSIAQRILATDSNNVAALIRVANAQAALGQRDAAQRSFTRAMTIAPDKTDATIGLGRLDLATDPAAAAALFQLVVDREPRNVAALIDFGIAKDLQGQHKEAQRVYRQALTVEPDRVATSVNLGLSLALSGDTGEAVAILRPLASDPGAAPRVRQDLAVALALSGDNAAATMILQKDIAAPAVPVTLLAYQMLRPKP
jgi:Flp pilus assembly protein TadD